MISVVFRLPLDAPSLDRSRASYALVISVPHDHASVSFPVIKCIGLLLAHLAIIRSASA